jgi:eukaryotic-like serine/threonine-protein kinase
VTPERWQQAREIFKSALDLEPSERSAFLSKACFGDESLRREVESLLASLDRGESFLETPTIGTSAEKPANTPAQLQAGQALGSYEVLNRIGEGGMGEVYLGRDTNLGRYVALKVLPANFTNDARRLRRFEQEARAASALNHPNIITIHEIRKADSTYFIATEFIDGVTLREHIGKQALKSGEALDIAAQIASALAAAHTAGVVHRDIKPENVMRRRDGIIKVLDFGLAKLKLDLPGTVEPEAPTKAIVKTSPGVVMGTVRYMSPEQALGHEVDERTDIWSLGVVLFEMLTGRVPFDGETSSHIIVSILENEPPPLARYVKIPAELERIVRKALRKDMEERYQTASDLALDLKSLKQELEVEVRLRSLQRGVSDGEAPKRDGSTGEIIDETLAHTRDVVTAEPISSAEYLLGAVKHHKLAVMAWAMALVVVVAVGVYFVNRDHNVEAIDSLAVLPFVNASGDSEIEYLSDGISDSIINSLSRLPNMKVISLNAVMRYKGRQPDPQEVARELNVRAVLMGRLVQRGDDLAISAELVDVRDNRRLWGEQYNRKLSDILVVQKDIAREIAEKLRLRLSGEDQKRLTERYTDNPEAYQLYLKGRYFWNKRTEDGFNRGIAQFKQAVEKDSNYALAHSGLADSYIGLTFYNFAAPNETMPKAKEAAVNALAIDNSLAEAHASLAHILLNYDWNWSEAEKHFKRSMELNPDYATGRQWYAVHYLTAKGRWEEALQEMRRVLELEPTSLVMNTFMGATLYFAGRYDEAIEQCRKTIEMDPTFAVAHWHLGLVYEQKGMFDEAVAEFNKAVTLSGDSPLMKAALGHAYAKSNRKREAKIILDELKELAGHRYVSSYEVAAIYVALGDNEQAFRLLERASSEHSFHLVYLNVWPQFSVVRLDPRFQSLVQRVGLAR